MKKELENEAINSILEAAKKSGLSMTRDQAQSVLDNTIKNFRSKQAIDPEIRKQLEDIIRKPERGISDVREFDGICDFIRNCHTGYDCDEDSHRYDTPCRVCEAEEVYKKLRGSDDCKEGNPCYIQGCVACFVRGNIAVLPGRDRIGQKP